MNVTIQGLVTFGITIGLIGFALGVWAAIFRAENAVDDLRHFKEISIRHLEALGGDQAVVLALAGKEPPAPRDALSIAEQSYLERSGWTPSSDGSGWCPRWAPGQSWTQPKAIEKQRLRDSMPPDALNALRSA